MRRLWTKICNFFYWGWALRENYDYDYGFLYDIMQLKLERMYACFLKDNIHCWTTINNKEMRRIRTCILLIDRIKTNCYMLDEFSAYLEKYGNKRNYKIKRSEKEEKEFKRISKKETQLLNNDRELLHKILKSNTNRWWI